MILQKQKKLVKSVSFKFGRELKKWPGATVELPVLIIMLGIILYSQPVSLKTPPVSKTTAIKTKPAIAKIAPAKITQPPTTTPKTAISTSSSVPTRSTEIPTQSGTPKQEPVVTPSPSSSVSGLTPTSPTTTSPTPASPTPPASTPSTTTGYTSTNWSGYLATNASFTSVSGSWDATEATGNGSSTSADATWIGIGGVTTDDLIQVGTENTISASGTVSTGAFYELLPNVSQPVPGVTVSEGDSISASVSQVNGDLWKISITDETDNESDTLYVTYSSSLSSAEWIEEDPSYSFSRQIPFDDFNLASFMNGAVTMNGSTTTIASSTAQPVTMVNDNGQVIAAPSVIGAGGTSFTINP